jgi:hypothetical protein
VSGFLLPTFTCFARVAACPAVTIRIHSAQVGKSIAGIVRIAEVRAKRAKGKARNPKRRATQQAASNHTKAKRAGPKVDPLHFLS